jgi:pimeloyl-ACP methyl ester carboxylesterase
MREPAMKTVPGKELAISIALSEGIGREILCIHGLTANCRCWDTIAESLVPDFQIIAMDLRGRGLSGKPATGYSIDHHEGDILAVIDALKIDKACLMGHSLGAFISLAFAARHPDRVEKLVLVDGGGMLPPDHGEHFTKAIKTSLDRLGRLFPSVEDYLAPMRESPFFRPWSDSIEAYFRYEVEAVEGGVRTRHSLEMVIEESINLRGIDFTKYYPMIACPVLILRADQGLAGQKDLLLADETALPMARAIADCRLVTVEGTNHYSIIFQPNEDRDRKIRAFLA